MCIMVLLDVCKVLLDVMTFTDIIPQAPQVVIVIKLTCCLFSHGSVGKPSPNFHALFLSGMFSSASSFLLSLSF